MWLIPLTIAWMLGSVVADELPHLCHLLGGVGLIGALTTLFGWRNKRIRLVGLLLLCFALGGWRYVAAQVPTTPHSIWRLAGQRNLVVQGVVQGDPKRTETGQQVILGTELARVAGQTAPAEGLLLVQLPPYPHYHYGQRLAVLGDIEEPRSAERPGEFDYRDYLARKRIFVMMRDPLVQTLADDAGNPLLRTLFDARDHCQKIVMRMLPDPQSSLAIGIILGLQSSIPEDVYDAFSVTGTSHILVVSGWNFTIVAAMLAGVASRLRLGRGSAFWLSLAVMWIYALFVGAGAAVLRAAVMASLMVLARTTERQSEPWTLLFVACWALTFHDPNALWDLGFQLSALATASLFAFGKPVERWLQRFPPLRQPLLAWATEALTATLAAQILALPIILYHFGNLSLVAPLANVIIVPVIPYAMLLGAATMVVGLVWLPLGQWLAPAVWLPLSWIAEGALLLAQAPWAAVRLPPFPRWLLLGYYALVIGWHLWRQYDQDRAEENNVSILRILGREDIV